LIVGPPHAQAQVLNTRPLSQPYVNPGNPNAGQMGRQYVPGTPQTLPRREIERRRALTTGNRPGCWVDSLGRYQCRPVR
jgi:hypothetical protein